MLLECTAFEPSVKLQNFAERVNQKKNKAFPALSKLAKTSCPKKALSPKIIIASKPPTPVFSVSSKTVIKVSLAALIQAAGAGNPQLETRFLVSASKIIYLPNNIGPPAQLLPAPPALVANGENAGYQGVGFLSSAQEGQPSGTAGIDENREVAAFPEQTPELPQNSLGYSGGGGASAVTALPYPGSSAVAPAAALSWQKNPVM